MIGDDPLSDETATPIFAVCVNAVDSDDLTAGMLYRVLPDEEAAGEELLRVVDDSGEDYLYPAGRFVVVEVPKADVPRLLTVSTPNVA